MPEPQFRGLQKQLLRGGVQMRHVSRVIAELKDHYCDLEEEILKSGRPAEQASAQAFEMLGDLDAVATQLLANPKLKSFVYRWPWMVVILRPSVLVAHLFVVPVLVIAERGTTIARWSMAGCFAAILTSTLFFLLQQLYAA